MVSLLAILFSCCLLAHQSVVAQYQPNKTSNNSNLLRIVGGEDATDIDIPWMVSIVYFGSHLCGGSIISPKTVATAAHCLDFVHQRYIKVRVGTKDRYSGGQLLRVKSFVTHEEFGRANFHNDIALIFVSDSIEYVKGVIEPIALPDYNAGVRDGEMAMVSGWGLLKHGSNVVPKILQYTWVPVVNHKMCNKLMRNMITNRQICAGYPEGGKDACQQDSGGPLVWNRLLIGIVSWGDECGKPLTPGVYTDVAALRRWVDEHIEI